MQWIFYGMLVHILNLDEAIHKSLHLSPCEVMLMVVIWCHALQRAVLFNILVFYLSL